VPHSDARLRAARASIAAACLDALPDAALGELRLREDQRHIVARARQLLDRHGGCLIGEEVGRGKTFIALALARRWRHPLVVVPASLRSTWQRAMERAGVPCAVASHEGLSRGHAPLPTFDGVIVDESHHYRTTTTHRYAALALLAARVPVVLLSATPLQNRVRDLAAQIALFWGERSFALDIGALARFVIRGPDHCDGLMPRVHAPAWLPLDADDGRVLSAILAIPPPARPLDGGDAGALRAIGLVRAWASSRAALQATLRARSRLATAIEQSVEAGRQPTRREARSWCSGAGDAVQLGFASLLVDGTPSSGAISELREALAQERDSLSALSGILRDVPDPDAARVAALRQIRQRHSGARIIAFSEYASTINALFGAMHTDASVGMLTSRDARIASGRIGRDELLARFAPIAQGTTPLASHHSVTLLLATDLLSEGGNLQDASVVVHLDLPWNPARLAQRVGRVRRPGGASEIRSYLLAPPAQAAALLDADARLRRKLVAAERAIGASFDVLPALTPPASGQQRIPRFAQEWHSASLGEQRDERDAIGLNAAARGAMFVRLAAWRDGATRPVAPTIAAVEAAQRGWLAALSDGRLLASFDDNVSDTTAFVAPMIELAEGASRHLTPGEEQAALSALHLWLAREDLAVTCGIDAPPGPLAQIVVRRVALLQRRLPRHLRAAALPLLASVRDAVRAPLPLGAERLLADHAMNLPSTSEAILEWAKAALSFHAGRPPREAESSRSLPRLLALIIAGPSTEH
jgi:superfamily II DNA or RNA helicase